ncbi:pyruvate kinase [Haladaptatus sp. DYSN1]|uniref:pyruvate kinase n=1 Tax=unclassified Haladaptatus TaxID=2622732 RepID=UPI0024061D46|nr:pyruvate kinase [Haladaptatus sp. DYSN1]
MRNAKIVCTLGPASSDPGVIRDLADAGMSVARLNTSHGSTDVRKDLIQTVQQVDEATAEPVSALLDLAGPEVRTAPLDDPIFLETGSTIEFYEGDDATPERVGLSVSIEGVSAGDRVLLDDGRIETVVQSVGEDTVTARVESGGELKGRKGVNVPGVDLGLDALTEDDRRELDLAVEAGVDFVAASFVGNAADIYTVREELENRGAAIPVIAKIERADAVDNLEEIVEAAYGIMVARGDLGVECPMEDVPIIQKRIIRTCREAGVPVITATEMLDSMIHSRRPTRAEASDVANAVLDGTDAVMLSAETAVGDHPVRVVETMDRIIREAESSDDYVEGREQRIPKAGESRAEALSRSARYLARDVGASAVVVASESGYTALKTAKFRPEVPVVAATPNDVVRRQLALSAGVIPQYVDLGASEGVGTIIDRAAQAALDAGVAESGDTVVVVSGMMSELEGRSTNMLKVHVAAEPIATGRSVHVGRAVGPAVTLSSGDLSSVKPGSIVVLPDEFDDQFDGDLSVIGGIVAKQPGLTGYPALVARELDVPMVSDAELAVADGTTVTLDAERGVVYEGNVLRGPRREPF